MHAHKAPTSVQADFWRAPCRAPLILVIITPLITSTPLFFKQLL